MSKLLLNKNIYNLKLINKIMNDGFYKLFTHISYIQYNSDLSWIIHTQHNPYHLLL